MVNRRLPPLRSLEAFMYTVRLGSARAAANQLSLSPSALSRRIATLEEFIGKKLFTRARQAMQLTDEGAAFHEAVLPHFEALSRAVEGQSENSSVLRLHLGVLPLFGTQRLFPRLAELRRLHPILHIDIDTGPHLEDRVGDTLDAAIILSRGPSSGLHAVRLDENKVHAITNAELAQQLGPKPDAAQLSRQTFLIHNELPESFTAWKAALGLDDLEPAAIDHRLAMLALAADGDPLLAVSDIEAQRPGPSYMVDTLRALAKTHPNAELALIVGFACHHLALGAERVHLFFDVPHDPAAKVAATIPGVTVTLCDAAYWREAGFANPPALQTKRQTVNANRVMAQSDLDWLLHADADELLWLPGPLADELAQVPEGAWLHIPNVERCWQAAPDGEIYGGIFRGPLHDMPGLAERVYGKRAAALSGTCCCRYRRASSVNELTRSSSVTSRSTIVFASAAMPSRCSTRLARCVAGSP